MRGALSVFGKEDMKRYNIMEILVKLFPVSHSRMNELNGIMQFPESQSIYVTAENTSCIFKVG